MPPPVRRPPAGAEMVGAESTDTWRVGADWPVSSETARMTTAGPLGRLERVQLQVPSLPTIVLHVDEALGFEPPEISR